MRKGNDANCLALSHQRHTQGRSYLAEDLHFGQRVFCVDSNVGDLDDLAFERDAPDVLPRPGANNRSRKRASKSGSSATVATYRNASPCRIASPPSALPQSREAA